MTIEFQERAIDRHFADFILRQSAREESAIVRLLLSLASSAVGKGNICLSLADIAGQTIVVDGKGVALPDLETLLTLLGRLSVVTLPGEQFRPLVIDAAARLYLHRYWRYEQELAALILQKAAVLPEAVDETLLRTGLDRLFPLSAEADRQREAASVALHKQLCIISGGPGTGKTSTVVKILALLIEQCGQYGQYGVERQRIAMAAPTGKAAARLKGSVSEIRQSLNTSEEIRSAIPDEVVTIQRLLGSVAGSLRFRHSARNPLPYDTVIVDEASMIALPLMTALVSALKPGARLILLGDRDQLASVEAGAVLGDMCSAGERQPGSPLNGSLVMLEKNYRFRAGSGILEISRAVNAGRDKEALELLKQGSLGGIAWHELPQTQELRKSLANKVIKGYQEYLASTSPAEALDSFDRFRILCALREGAYGVTGLNSMVENILGGAGMIEPAGRWYPFRPILVTANDYAMRLFNGETGILFPDIENGGALRAFFPAPDGGVRTIPVERLPRHETAFAMTIHKSQGSEFDRLLMILPPVDGALLTRELLYTGITRARREVEIWSDEGVFSSAVRKRSERNSGLRDALLLPRLRL